MYTKILVPLDGSERAERILPHVEMLAKSAGAEVVLLRVVDPTIDEIGPSFYMAGTAQDLELHWDLLEKAEAGAKNYMKQKVQALEAKGINARSLVLRGSVVDAIVSQAEEQKVDLVAMASHGRTGLRRAFYGSVANGVLHKIEHPLLLVRAEQ
jgi:nucleotide-binding universal stress UspA family protein